MNAPIGAVYYGIKIIVFSQSGIVWLTVPRNDHFISEDGFHDCLRQYHYRPVLRV